MNEADSLTVWWWRNAIRDDAVWQYETDAMAGFAWVIARVFFPIMLLCDLAYLPLHWVLSRLGRATR